jgi:hypothetical protein
LGTDSNPVAEQSQWLVVSSVCSTVKAAALDCRLFRLWCSLDACSSVVASVALLLGGLVSAHSTVDLQLISMIPMFGNMGLGDGADKETQAKFRKYQTIMDSMTDKELDDSDVRKLFDPVKIRRVAYGSGCSLVCGCCSRQVRLCLYLQCLLCSRGGLPDVPGVWDEVQEEHVRASPGVHPVQPLGRACPPAFAQAY